MIERIKYVMEYYNLSPSELADSIQVPRSSISHLLTGRNKPSLDFVLKLIKTYPDVNLYWLLNGKGTFPKKNELVETAPPTPLVPEVLENIEKKTTSPTSDQHPNKSAPKNISRIVFFFDDGSFEAYGAN